MASKERAAGKSDSRVNRNRLGLEVVTDCLLLRPPLLGRWSGHFFEDLALERTSIRALKGRLGSG